MARTAKTVEAKTTAKYTASHDRLTLTVKFADGTKFRLNSSRYRDSCSYDASIREQAEKFFGYYIDMDKTHKNETRGQRFERLKSWFEQFETAQAAVASI